MKKFVCILIAMITMIGIITGGVAETANNYSSLEDYLSRNELEVITVDRNEFLRVFDVYGDEETVLWIYNKLSIEENERPAMLCIEPDNYQRTLVLVFDVSENYLPLMDREIIRSFIVELV